MNYVLKKCTGGDKLTKSQEKINRLVYIDDKKVQRVSKWMQPINMIILFTNPSARAGYDTRSIFKRSLTGLNSEFSCS